jgi:hypothetical protein
VSAVPTSSEGSAASKAIQYEVWAKYEDVAMHFNDLLVRLRLQAMGGLATLVTIAGFVVGDAVTLSTRYQAMLILTGMLTFAWVGVAIIDLCYYSRLLRGAADALIELESGSTVFTLSTRIESSARGGGVYGPRVFYGIGLVPLVTIFVWGACQLQSLPPEKRDQQCDEVTLREVTCGSRPQTK